MTKGFQIEIQKELTEEESRAAIDFANEWISKTCSKDMQFLLKGKGGHRSYIRRNRFGYMLNDKVNDLVFRRISTHKRIFGIIKADTMVKPDGSEVNLNQCMCSIHRGGERVVWRDGKPEVFVYAVVGSVKN